MFDTPMVIVNGVTGAPTPIIDDTYSEGHSVPKPNPTNLYNLVSTKTTDVGFELVLSRSVKILREGRNETLDFFTDIDMVYAFRDEKFSYHGGTQRGFFSMQLNNQTGVVSFNGQGDAQRTFYKIHGIILYTTWCIVSFLVLVSGRYMRHLYKFRMVIHASMGILLVTNTVIIVLLSLTQYPATGTPKYSHKTLGIVIMVMSLLQAVGGITVKKTISGVKWNQKLSLRTKFVHQIFGFITIIISNAQVVTGLYNYESPVKNLIFLHFAVYILIIVAIEILYRFRFQYKEKGVIRKQGIPEYTRKEFDELIIKGSQLVLFNNYVLDIEGFKDEHPGTAFVLKENIGNEIGKYFYGAYSMEQDVAPYVHSGYAATLLERLVIGKLLHTNGHTDKVGRTSINYNEGDNFICLNSNLQHSIYSDYACKLLH
jgi:hypothetical protein